jgi:hypothetical protein
MFSFIHSANRQYVAPQPASNGQRVNSAPAIQRTAGEKTGRNGAEGDSYGEGSE